MCVCVCVLDREALRLGLSLHKCEESLYTVRGCQNDMLACKGEASISFSSFRPFLPLFFLVLSLFRWETTKSNRDRVLGWEA